MMPSSLRAAFLGVLAILPVGCANEAILARLPPILAEGLRGTPRCAASSLEFTDGLTGEPLVGALVDWAAADPEDLADLSVEQYLDEFGEAIGITDDDGRLYLPICGKERVLDFVNGEFVPSHELTLIRLNSASLPIAFQFRHVVDNHPEGPSLIYVVDGAEIRVASVRRTSSVDIEPWYDSWRDLVFDLNDYP